MDARLIDVHQLDRESIQTEYRLNERTQKTITFVYPLVQDGLLGSMIKFSHSGIVLEVDAFCVVTGVEDTVIDIERISKKEFEAGLDTWESIFGTKQMTIPANRKRQDSSYNFSSNAVDKDDMFRVKFLHTGPIATQIDNLRIRDLTIQIKIAI